MSSDDRLNELSEEVRINDKVLHDMMKALSRRVDIYHGATSCACGHYRFGDWSCPHCGLEHNPTA